MTGLVFDPTSHEAEVAAGLRDLAARMPERAVMDDAARERREWGWLVDVGALGAAVRSEIGGLGGAARLMAAVMSELGAAEVTAPARPAMIIAAMLDRFGDESDVGHIVGVISGKTRCAIQLRGSKAARPEIASTTDSLKLLGGAAIVESSMDADLILLRAHNVSDGREHLLLLDRADVPDITFASGLREVVLPPAQLRNSKLLGSVGNGNALAAHDGLLALLLAAETSGIMRRLLWATRDYVCLRSQFGQPVGKFQAVQHRLSDMFMRSELFESLLGAAAAAFDQGSAQENPGIWVRPIAFVQAAADRWGVSVMESAIQAHGGMGMTRELPAARAARRLHDIQAMDIRAEARLLSAFRTGQDLVTRNSNSHNTPTTA